MEGTILPAAEVAEYVEFKRTKREAEVALMLNKLLLDASRRETDRHALRSICESAKKLGACGILVSPVNVGAARKLLQGSEVRIICLVGGTGESLPAVKKLEAKKAIAHGAKEIRLVLCYSALTGGNYSYLKREIGRLRRATRRCTLSISLEDQSLGEEQIALGVRAACDGKADGVSVRGETALVLHAISYAAGRLTCDCSGVENAEQLNLVVKAGASHALTRRGEDIARELYEAAEAASAVGGTPVSEE